MDNYIDDKPNSPEDIGYRSPTPLVQPPQSPSIDQGADPSDDQPSPPDQSNDVAQRMAAIGYRLAQPNSGQPADISHAVTPQFPEPDVTVIDEMNAAKVEDPKNDYERNLPGITFQFFLRRSYAIKRWRMGAGFTHAELGKRLGVSMDTVRYWERTPTKIKRSNLLEMIRLGFPESEAFHSASFARGDANV